MDHIAYTLCYDIYDTGDQRDIQVAALRAEEDGLAQVSLSGAHRQVQEGLGEHRWEVYNVKETFLGQVDSQKMTMAHLKMSQAFAAQPLAQTRKNRGQSLKMAWSLWMDAGVVRGAFLYPGKLLEVVDMKSVQDKKTIRSLWLVVMHSYYCTS